MTNEEFKQWKTERDVAFAGSLEEFTAYAVKMGQIPSDPAIYEVMYHKCRTAAVSLPMDIRLKSNQWLLDHGYTSFL